MSRTADLPDSLALALRANMGPIRIRGGLDYRERRQNLLSTWKLSKGNRSLGEMTGLVQR